ncbi:hypothetical protein KRR40_33120 [Niabella defluvii]|nr:hypothetical protein KRR40_33120 [Niabella sp. I65]
MNIFFKGKLKWKNKTYRIHDFLTNEMLGSIQPGEKSFRLTTGARDALWVKLVEMD